MNDGQKGLGKKTRLRGFRLWLILAAAIFLILLAVTQFLPGGMRSFSDWVWPLSFLFAISLAAATIVCGVSWVIRLRFCWNNFRWFVFALAGVAALIAMFYVKTIWREWRAWSWFPN